MAVWFISYYLDPENEDKYLNWFHQIHMQEKLKRRGYVWASHYRSFRNVSDGDGLLYLALFGGDSTAVFYNPSPAQLRQAQTSESRTMMDYRLKSRSLILSHEWVFTNKSGVSCDTIPIDSPNISLMACGTGGNDMDFCSWLIQKYLSASTGRGVAKFLASTGEPRHVMIHMQNIKPSDELEFPDASYGAWGSKVAKYLTYPLGSPVISMEKIFSAEG